MKLEEYTNRKLLEFTEKELEKYADDKLDNLELAAAGCTGVQFNILTGGAGIAFAVVLGLIAAALIYMKWFRGSIDFSKLTAKLKRK